MYFRIMMLMRNPSRNVHHSISSFLCPIAVRGHNQRITWKNQYKMSIKFALEIYVKNIFSPFSLFAAFLFFVNRVSSSARTSDVESNQWYNFWQEPSASNTRMTTIIIIINIITKSNGENSLKGKFETWMVRRRLSLNCNRYRTSYVVFSLRIETHCAYVLSWH